MGMNLNEMFPSKWLKAEDFGEGENKVVTIKDVKYETLGQGAKAETKPVIEFRDAKPLVLNKTNGHIIGQLYGSDTDEWVGKKITLFTMEVDSFGDIVRAIRVRNAVPDEAASRQSTPGTSNQSAGAAMPHQTAMPQPPQTGDQMITAPQKTLILREAQRAYGEQNAVNKVKELIGNVNGLSYQDAEAWITWLKEQPNCQIPADAGGDDDPFGDE